MDVDEITADHKPLDTILPAGLSFDLSSTRHWAGKFRKAKFPCPKFRETLIETSP